MAAHKHAALIKAWADGAEIEVRGPNNSGEWYGSSEPSWKTYYEYRIKPVEPEREYPRTTMSIEDVSKAWSETEYGHRGLLSLVNIGLRHACDNGQIVTRAEFDRAVGDRATRDMAVARAMNQAFCLGHANDALLRNCINGVKP